MCYVTVIKDELLSRMFDWAEMKVNPIIQTKLTTQIKLVSFYNAIQDHLLFVVIATRLEIDWRIIGKQPSMKCCITARPN